MQVYERLRNYLSHHNIDPESIANKSGIPPASMKAILSGRKKLYVDDLKAICIALKVSVDTFIEHN